MSHDAHGASGDGLPPQSTGVHWGVTLLFVVGVALTIMQGVFVAGLSSPYGRVFPSTASATVKLPASNLK